MDAYKSQRANEWPLCKDVFRSFTLAAKVFADPD
jgi:hypothetical protein